METRTTSSKGTVRIAETSLAAAERTARAYRCRNDILGITLEEPWGEPRWVVTMRRKSATQEGR